MPNAFLVLVGLLVGSGASELIARYSLPDPNSYGPPAIFMVSPIIPFTTRPLAEHLDIRGPRGDYVYSAHLDSRGFRRNGPGQESGSLDGRGTLVVGDSFAFGMGVDDDQTVAAQLAGSALKATCLGPVVNAGWRAGNNPATLAAWLAGQPAGFRPRVILHLVFPANDLSDIVPLELHRDGRGDLMQVRDEAAYVDESGRRRFSDRAGLRPARDWLRNHVRLYYPLYESLAKMLPSIFGEQRRPRRDLDQARDVAIGAMQQSARRTTSGAGRYLVVFVPSVEEVRGGRWQPSAIALIEAVRETGITTIDLLTGQPALTAGHYFPTDPHWNASGHVVVSHQLLSHLLAMSSRVCAEGSSRSDPA
jgi:hypothetical protein